ncbi:DUF262 domain-containing protein [Euhalothece natronophila Z-M001]|uniref:DUF262 domain-containing protein n=1 Tax=Euhalothece natronophila Z-M001 TaxID=522448 RepID=A0A5B8NQE9_9CHRO|nr:DUF262 domain-containing protein [Euhalothece natronophila]QDZ41167.1 DUF262 domain-containing protein [Euhalothece natronophila Z-M001]
MSIQATQKQLSEIFTLANYQFWIPEYQRPYAWTQDLAGEMLNDLLDVFPDQEESDSDYFLGSIILVKKEGKPQAEVIDGQQRLTTLTLLLATIRHLLPPNHISYQKISDRLSGNDDIGNKIIGLKLREQDEDFFNQYVRKAEGMTVLLESDAGFKTDSQKLLRDNAIFLVEQLTSSCPDQTNLEPWLLHLLNNLLNHCYLVVVTTSDFDTAYRIFSTINTRGLELQINDILKAEIIGAIPDDKQKSDYTRIWELEESDLGRDDFQFLFSHIHRIQLRERPKVGLLSEYRNRIEPKEYPCQFIDSILKPCSDAFEVIRDGQFNCDDLTQQSEINRLFGWLNRIDNSDWLPPAIHFLVSYPENASKVLSFFTQLERLAAGLMILRRNINERAERYRHLLAAIDEGIDTAIIKCQQLLSQEEHQQILEILAGNIYLQSRIRLYVLLRLDSALAEGSLSPSFNAKLNTIEHVLPQTLSPSWEKMGWTPELHENWVHRLGNLVLLSRKKNAAAGNYSYEKKKTAYFQSGSATVFPITTRVLSQPEWTPAIVESNQSYYLNTLKKIWNY